MLSGDFLKKAFFYKRPFWGAYFLHFFPAPGGRPAIDPRETNPCKSILLTAAAQRGERAGGKGERKEEEKRKEKKMEGTLPLIPNFLFPRIYFYM